MAKFSTLGLGGPARALTRVSSGSDLVSAVRNADNESRPVLLLAGGSNVVISDAGFGGEVVLVRSAGIKVDDGDNDVALVRVEAGHVFDEFVAWAVAEGLSGVECLSGIPGSVGATPIQNVGAYGQEVASVIVGVHLYDRQEQRELTLAPSGCHFSYRDSLFKHNPRYVVVAVTFALRRTEASVPLRYGELTRRLGVEPDGSAPLPDVRAAVLELRRAKGMVLDPNDPDTRSVGSFFTNPVLTTEGWQALVSRCDSETPPRWDTEDGGVKTSAAWLIEHAGFHRGYGYTGVAISSKHTLALTNRGDGTTQELLKLAYEIRDGVRQRFGVELVPEPVLIGLSW